MPNSEKYTCNKNFNLFIDNREVLDCDKTRFKYRLSQDKVPTFGAKTSIGTMNA